MNRSQIHECRNWERGRAVSFLRIYKSDFRYSVGMDFFQDSAWWKNFALAQWNLKHRLWMCMCSIGFYVKVAQLPFQSTSLQGYLKWQPLAAIGSTRLHIAVFALKVRSYGKLYLSRAKFIHNFFSCFYSYFSHCFVLMRCCQVTVRDFHTFTDLSWCLAYSLFIACSSHWRQFPAKFIHQLI